MLRVADIAIQLGVTPGRVYQLVANHQIPFVRIAGSIRVPEDAWERWLEDRLRVAGDE